MVQIERTIVQYPSTGGGVMIRGLLWRPLDRPIRGVVQICHGMAEYVRRYDAFAAFLCEHGFAVGGGDHLGHGMTATHPDELGFIASDKGDRLLVEDALLFSDHLRECFPGVPFFLFGHSMGSFIARLAAARRPLMPDALLLSGTGGRNPALPFGLALAEAQKKQFGPKHKSPRLDRMIFGPYQKNLPDVTHFEWLSRDMAVVAAYVADPLCGFPFTVSAYADLFRLTREANRPDWFSSLPKELPVYLFSGDRDPVGDWGKGVKQVRDHLVQAGLTDVTLRLYPGGRHEMLNEINRDAVYADVLRFLEDHMPAAES